MNKLRPTIATVLALALSGISVLAQGQYQRGNRNDRATRELIQRIETETNRFRDDLASALDQSRLDNTQREDNINQQVADFQAATSQLRDQFDQRRVTDSDVRAVLDRAVRIDNFMQRRRMTGEAERNWAMIRRDLDQLASSYNVAWNWNNVPARGNYGGNNSGNRAGNYVGDARLTGTYRLNTSRSTDARRVIDDAVRSMPAEQQQRVTQALLRRVEPPEVIAIERRGRTFIVASSRAPEATFEANGQEYTEQYPNSQRTSRVRVTLSGDQLVINSTGDRASDYTVTFDPINNGNGLRVTRRLYSDRLSQPVIVESFYDRTSDVAQRDIYTGAPSRSDNYPTASGVRGDYIIPNGMTLVASLNDDLVTSRSRSGDRFTMTVTSPAEYEGATIEGVVGNIDRGGRVTGRSEMALNFDRIRLRNGQSYPFEGTIETVRATNGDVIRVDNEGSVQESNQTNRTVKRTAIGTAIGAVLGAIAGGGSGAAIGAVVGAGAGAGSVYVQGRNDLELMRGTELTIRASSPNPRG